MNQSYALMICLVTEAGVIELEIKWVIDSGCTHHSCNDINQFTDFENVTANITIADGSIIKSSGRGTVGEFRNVNYVPQFAFYLLSVKQLTADGNDVTFAKDGSVIISNKHENMRIGHFEHGMYTSLQARDQTQKHTIKPDSYSDITHQRWGHAYIDRLMHAQQNNLIQGLHKIQPIHFCDACAKAKMTLSTRNKQTGTDAEKYTLLSKIMCDISGKIHIQGIQGVHYFMLFIDHASRYKWIYFIKELSTESLLDAFKKFYLRITAGQEKVSSLCIMKTFKTDCAPQFKDRIFTDYVQSNGISLEYSAPYSHHQNGIAERAIRSIREMGISQMIHARAPPYLWPYAFRHSVYLMNRLPTGALGFNTTPYIKMFGIIPEANVIKVFGCDAYALIQNKHKHGPRANKGLYVGQADTSTAYLFYNPDTRSVSETLHIKFNEDVTSPKLWTVNDEQMLLAELDEQSAKSISHQPAINEEASRSLKKAKPNDPDEEENIETQTKTVPIVDDSKSKTRSGREYGKEIQNALISGEYVIIGNHIDAVNTDVLDFNNLRFEQAIAIPEWKDSINKEVESLLVEKEVGDIVEMKDVPHNRTLVNYKWTFKKKTDEHSQLLSYKTRLVAKGFSQREGIDYTETFSPVARITTLRLILSLGASEGFYYAHVDIKTAFLNATLEENIYMKLPSYFVTYMQEKYNKFMEIDVKTAEKDYAIKLNKSIYGLKQAGREWYQMLDEYIQRSMGFNRSQSDVCLYFRGGKEDKVLLVVYVDDVIIGSANQALRDSVKDQIKKRFKMQSDKLHYYIGIQITQTSLYQVRLQQTKYLNKIFERSHATVKESVVTPMSKGIKYTTKMCPKTDAERELMEHADYRSGVSSLMYAALLTRPDFTYPTNVTARFMNDPGILHNEALLRIFQYAKNTSDKFIQYDRMTCTELMNKMICFVDASHADTEELKTSCGFLIYMNGGPISWRTHVEDTHAMSPTESEYMSLYHATKEVLSLRNIMEEIGFAQTSPTPIYEDNEAAIAIVKNPKKHHNLKHIELKYHLTRRSLENGSIEVLKVDTTEQDADIMTKALARKEHIKFTDRMVH